MASCKTNFLPKTPSLNIRLLTKLLCVQVCACEYSGRQKPETLDSPEAEVTGNCEPSNTGDNNQAHVLEIKPRSWESNPGPRN